MPSHASWIARCNCGTVCGGWSYATINDVPQVLDGCQVGWIHQPGWCVDCIGSQVFLCEADSVGAGVVLLEGQAVNVDVGHTLGLDHLIHVTLGIEGAIQHDRSHLTPATLMIRFSNAGIHIVFTYATAYSDPPSPWERQNRESSVSRTCLQSRACQLRCAVTQWSLDACQGLIRTGLWYGHGARRPNCLRWLRMVWVEIVVLPRPGVSAAVHESYFHRSRRCMRRIFQSCADEVTGGCLLCGWSLIVSIY